MSLVTFINQVILKKKVYVWYRLCHFVNKVNIYAMHILCLNKTNDAVTLAIIIFSQIHFEPYVCLHVFGVVRFECFVCAKSISALFHTKVLFINV